MENTLVESYDVINEENNAFWENGMIRQHNTARSTRFNQLKNSLCVCYVVVVVIFLHRCFFFSTSFFGTFMKRSFGVMIHSLSIWIVWSWPPLLSICLSTMLGQDLWVHEKNSSKSYDVLNGILLYMYVNASPLMIYILIEFHLTGIDFVWNGKILIKKKVSTTTTKTSQKKWYGLSTRWKNVEI